MTNKQEEKEIKNDQQSEGVEDVTFEKQEVKDEELSDNEDTESEMSSKKEDKKLKKSGSQKKIKELEDKLEEQNDKYLRLYSEFDNYRKRTIKERIELQMSASKELILETLAVVDDLERAIQFFEDHKLSQEAKQGIQLIYNKMMNILKQKGLETIEVQSKEFDTDFMEAITNIPAPTEDMKGKVVDVIQKGYLLNGKILRFAKVVVGQ
ncbi:MAG: nucleotide exchange factor GrpE [Bacteroidales bacterium]|nr:nucleotide exchange factor GrpE [Bacteroidales bacterium]